MTGGVGQTLRRCCLLMRVPYGGALEMRPACKIYVFPEDVCSAYPFFITAVRKYLGRLFGNYASYETLEMQVKAVILKFNS